MAKAMLERLYGINHQVVLRNIEGMTHEDSLKAPAGGGNPANWVLGHIIMHRDRVLETLGERATWGPIETEMYARGTSLPAEPLALERLVAHFDSQQLRLATALAKFDEARLDEPLEKDTIGWRLAFLQFHEAYHAGQLGLLRRLAGKPGAIA